MILFRELAEAFKRLEHTSSSSALVTILAEFLSRLSPDEVKSVAYLVRGEVAAPFEAQEIGIAERMAVRAVADAYAVPEQRVILSTAGDLGTAAEQLAGARRGRLPLKVAANAAAPLRAASYGVVAARRPSPPHGHGYHVCSLSIPTGAVAGLYPLAVRGPARAGIVGTRRRLTDRLA